MIGDTGQHANQALNDYVDFFEGEYASTIGEATDINNINFAASAFAISLVALDQAALAAIPSVIQSITEAVANGKIAANSAEWADIRLATRDVIEEAIRLDRQEADDKKDAKMAEIDSLRGSIDGTPDAMAMEAAELYWNVMNTFPDDRMAPKTNDILAEMLVDWAESRGGINVFWIPNYSIEFGEWAGLPDYPATDQEYAVGNLLNTLGYAPENICESHRLGDPDWEPE